MTNEPNIVAAEYVDHDSAYGVFGKVVARSNVRGMTDAEIEAEKAEMLALFGPTVNAVEVEEVPAVRPSICMNSLMENLGAEDKRALYPREVVTPTHVIQSDSPIYLSTSGSRYSIILNDIEYRSDTPMHVKERS